MRKLIPAILLVAGLVPAQEFRGAISGTVTDPSGAPIGGAKVEVISIERNVTYEALANDEGLYLARFLPPGGYRMTVEKPGFRKLVREGIQLLAADRLRQDFRLEVGAVAESITVTGDVSQLATETATRASTIEAKLVDDIPVNGRNMFQFQYSLPGVIKTSRYWGSYELYAFGNINSVSINGGRSGENETLIDGVTSTRGSRSASFAPSLNAIQEVSVVTNAYDASYGRIGGGVTAVTLKTGTNQLHGQLYHFLKNDNLISNGYSRNAANIRRPEYKNNTFGFTVDGPVYLPKILDGRNKMFFMLSTEFLRERNPQTQLWTVPTEAYRRGDFSALVNNAGQRITIHDPASTRSEAGRFVRTPFANNVIPQAQVNQVAQRAAGYYPNPNRASEGLDGQNNYLFINSSRNSYSQWLGKLDWNITQKSRVSGRYGETPWYNFARIQWGTNAAEPSGEFPSTRISRNWGADWTYTLNSTTVLNLRGGLARYEGFSGNTFGGGFDPRQLGFPDALVRQFTTLQFPRFNLSDLNYSPLGATQTSGYETQDTYSIQPNVQMIRGRHNMKWGAELRLYNDNRHQPGSASGAYGFTRAWTQADPQRADALSGNVFASFMLGYPANGSVPRNMYPAWQNKYYSLFFQDDWKLARNLTLNLGLRWDYEGPMYERYNRMVNGFAFGQTSPIQSSVQGLNLRGGMLFAGEDNRLAFERDRNNWQPRIGVAWNFSEKWVMRGGYGLFIMGQNAAGAQTGFSRTTSLVASTDNNLTPAVSLSNPFPQTLFPNGLLQPIGSSLGLSTDLGLGVGAQFRNRPLPYVHQFSYGFQRDLIWGWVGDVSYVGNITRKLPISANLNFLPVAALDAVAVDQRPAYFSQQVANPMAGLLPGSGINGANVPRQQLLFAYPHFSQVNISNIPAGRSDYHSLQAKFTRRYRNGFTGQVSYTWSKTIEEVTQLNAQTADLNDLTRTRGERRLVEFDMPHTVAVVATYELPFGRGKRFMSGANRTVNAILGGWNLNGQYMRRSGQPIDFPNAAPIRSGTAKLSASQRDALARAAGRAEFNPFFDKYFDTALFPTRAQAPFTLRDFPTRFPDVRSVPLTSWEASVYKEWRYQERVRFQLRLDGHNLFDYPYFGRLIGGGNSVTDPRFGQLDPAQGNQPKTFVLVGKIYW
ncbi:MAG: hypothetical protein C0504_14955 [Candidatus Solibacter sp.]|nr:hypothetical protein [Candidatus Solibacter sp.]